LHGPHSDEDFSGIFPERDEFVMQVEFSGRLIDRFSNHSDRGDLRRILPTPMEGIHEQQPSELLSLVLAADGQPAQQRGWNEIWEAC
jgi:hypothetical protein